MDGQGGMEREDQMVKGRKVKDEEGIQRGRAKIKG